MKNLVSAVKDYVKEVLGDITGGQPWTDASKLPFFLQDLYLFHCIEILDKPCLLVICRNRSGETPAVIRKHCLAVTEHYANDIIYVVEAITSFNRKRLIEQKVSFIVPGNQLYLPMLGLDLREHFKDARNTKQKALSAVAQLLLISYILGRYNRSLSVKELARLLGYSAMTLTRAIKELAEKDLALAEIIGREKRLTFSISVKELWSKVLPDLQNPIKKSVWIAMAQRPLSFPIAGESALAESTIIAAPENRTMAIYAVEWPGLKKRMGLEEREEQDIACIQLQLWRYNPALLTEGKTVDPLSLWLSLKDIKDERVDMALDQLMESFWS